MVRVYVTHKTLFKKKKKVMHTSPFLYSCPTVQLSDDKKKEERVGIGVYILVFQIRNMPVGSGSSSSFYFILIFLIMCVLVCG